MKEKLLKLVKRFEDERKLYLEHAAAHADGDPRKYRCEGWANALGMVTSILAAEAEGALTKVNLRGYWENGKFHEGLRPGPVPPFGHD